MSLNVNCKYSDRAKLCTNEQVKRSSFGLGPRYCMERHYECRCNVKEPYPKPLPPPSPLPPKKRIIKEDAYRWADNFFTSIAKKKNLVPTNWCAMTCIGLRVPREKIMWDSKIRAGGWPVAHDASTDNFYICIFTSGPVSGNIKSTLPLISRSTLTKFKKSMKSIGLWDAAQFGLWTILCRSC